MLFVFFWASKMGVSVYALRTLRFCNVTITPLAHAWMAGLALRLRLGERASKINIMRILSCRSQFVSPFDIQPSFLAIIRCVRLDQSTAVGVVGAMRPAMLPALVCAWRHVVWLISNVIKNSNMWPLHPDTMPLIAIVRADQTEDWADDDSRSRINYHR